MNNSMRGQELPITRQYFNDITGLSWS